MPAITLSVSSENWDEFKEAFLLTHEVPPDPETQQPTMTEEQWIKEKIRQMVWTAYRQGRKIKRNRAYSEDADQDIIT